MKRNYILGYEGLYSIDIYSNIWSHLSSKLLSQCFDKNRYLLVQLCRHGKISTKRVHRLVALTYIPNPYNYPQVNHKDGNKQNNNVDNLEWCTVKENNLHMYEILCKVAKLDNFKVLEIREKYATCNYTQKEIAEEYNVDPSLISFVVNHKIWK